MHPTRPGGTVPPGGPSPVRRGTKGGIVPKLPKNMVKRGKTFVFRTKVAGRPVRVALGSDYEEACRRLRSLKHDVTLLLPSVTVEDAARRWLSGYVPTVRREKDQRLAAQRV